MNQDSNSKVIYNNSSNPQYLYTPGNNYYSNNDLQVKSGYENQYAENYTNIDNETNDRYYAQKNTNNMMENKYYDRNNSPTYIINEQMHINTDKTQTHLLTNV